MTTVIVSFRHSSGRSGRLKVQSGKKRLRDSMAQQRGDENPDITYTHGDSKANGRDAVLYDAVAPTTMRCSADNERGNSAPISRTAERDLRPYYVTITIENARKGGRAECASAV
ncbi:hypothetical protein EVAR_62607_1 [Eumeta japonica]|uniref:Uncharacterized protein n=1 Tax=Eumeta variegata TaxID=151549 RepID=A0A4C1ZD02_EUMVA|nr:hypothetical protein EVAR_62607_1 [Eumeta japonica]